MRRPSPLFAALPLAGALVATRAAALPVGSGGRCAPLDDLAHAPPREPARGVDEPLAPPPADTASYAWEVRLDPAAHTLEGTGTVTFVNRSCAPLKELWVHLYLNAFKNDQSLFNRDPSGGFRGGNSGDPGSIDVHSWVQTDGESAKSLWKDVDLHGVPGDTSDETDARIPLATAIAPGETATFRVTFTSKLPEVVLRTGYAGSFHFAGQWFPKLAVLSDDGTFVHFPFRRLSEFFADFGRYDVTIDTPESFAIGAVGISQGIATEHGHRRERFLAEHVHDFAFAAWDQFVARDETIDGIAVHTLAPRGCEAIVGRELAALRTAIPQFRARFGPYPYPNLTVVHPPAAAEEAGGMEYPTLITTGGSCRTPSFLHSPELLTIHEFGHEYFYGLVATNEAAFPWLDEGINSFAQNGALCSKLFCAGSFLDLPFLRVASEAIQGPTSNAFAADISVGSPAASFPTGGHYTFLVYGRVPAIFETFARVYGREKLDKLLATWTRRYRFRHPSPDDFYALMGQIYSDSEARTFRAAIDHRGTVDDALRSFHYRRVRRELRAVSGFADGHVGDEYQGFVTVARRGDLAIPTTLAVRFEDGSEARLPLEGGREDATGGATLQIPITGRARPTFATLDPDGAMLLDGDRSNDSIRAVSEDSGKPTVGKSSAKGTFSRVFSALLALLGGAG